MARQLLELPELSLDVFTILKCHPVLIFCVKWGDPNVLYGRPRSSAAAFAAARHFFMCVPHAMAMMGWNEGGKAASSYAARKGTEEGRVFKIQDPLYTIMSARSQEGNRGTGEGRVA